MKQITQNITVSDGSGNEFATMSIPWVAATGDSTSGQISTSFSGIRMYVEKGRESYFDNFVYALTTTSSQNMGMNVKAAAVASTAVGDLTIDGMNFNEPVPLQGMNGLKGAPITIDSIVVRGGTPQAMQIDISVGMPNPSNVGITVGRVQYDAYFNKQKIGTVIIPNMIMNPGANTVQSTMYFSPQTAAAKAAGRKLMSGYLQGQDALVGMAGNPNDVTAIQSLKRALSAIQIQTTMPGLQGVSVMRGAYIAVDFTKLLFQQEVFASFDAYNPLDAPIKFIKMNTNMSFQGQSVGTLNQDLSSNPMVIPPKSVQRSQRFPFKPLLNSLQALKNALTLGADAFKGTLAVDVTAVIVASVGDYVMTIDFAQKGITATFG